MNDDFYMKEVIALARKGAGFVSPNPLVGAVVVKDGQIAGRGFHQRFGGNHAEIEAFNNANQDLSGASLYVNLEPCCHTEKQTPPCSREIIKRGIRRVVVGMVDPNPAVFGNGIAELEKAGIEVVCNVMQQEVEKLNEFYIKHVTTGMPFTLVKVATSIDGKIALSNGKSKWITGAQARGYVHGLRHDVDAILVGCNTVLTDDPELTTRNVENGRSPIRVVLDESLKISASARVFNKESRTILVTGLLDEGERKKIAEIGCEHMEIKLTPFGLIDIATLQAKLGKIGITSLLIEGGSSVLTSVLKEKLADKMIFMLALKLLGADALPVVGPLQLEDLSEALVFKNTKVIRSGDDIIVEGYPEYGK